MNYMYSITKNALDKALLPRGFINIDDNYYHWNTSTNIVTFISHFIESSSEFVINIGVKSIYQGVKLNPIQDIQTFDIGTISDHYGLGVLDNINRNPLDGRRQAYTKYTFEHKLLENIDRLSWLIDNIYMSMDTNSLYTYLSALSSYRSQYDIKDSEYSIPEPFEDNFYLAISIGNYIDAAKILLFIYNVNRRHGQYGIKNDFEHIRMKLKIDLNDTFNEWYINTFYVPFWNTLASDYLSNKRKEWMKVNEKRIINIVTNELFAKSDIMNSLINNTAQENIEYLKTLIVN